MIGTEASRMAEAVSDLALDLIPNMTVLQNLKSGNFKGSITEITGKVLSIASVGDVILIGTLNNGCHIYRYDSCTVDYVTQVGCDTNKPSACHYLSAHEEYFIYIKEYNNTCSVCLHKLDDVISGESKEPMRTLAIQRPAPLVVDYELGLVLIGGLCWKSSWVNATSKHNDSDGIERTVSVLELQTFTVVKTFTATTNDVAHMKLQVANGKHLLGISDKRIGISIYDLTSPTNDGYVRIFEIPVEEVRDFQLCGSLVGVFHRFEPNVSFWTIEASRTILCINIQEQLRSLTSDDLIGQGHDPDDLCETDDADSGLSEDDEDYVTSSVSVHSREDVDNCMLVYGTRSGCMFGLSTLSRRKVFSIPFAIEDGEFNPVVQRFKRDVRGLLFLPGGKLAVCYEGYGLALLDFNITESHERPKTRKGRK